VVTGLAVESPDQKTRFFLVLVVFSWWFLRHVDKMFNEMSVRL
jgi:hypothetical protein